MANNSYYALTALFQKPEATDARLKLAKLLLACPSLATPSNRQTVTSNLRSPIKEKVSYGLVDNGFTAALNLVNDCLLFEDGLAQLVNIMRYSDEETIPFKELEAFLADILENDIATPAAPTTENLSPAANLPLTSAGYEYLGFCKKLLITLDELQKDSPVYRYAGVPAFQVAALLFGAGSLYHYRGVPDFRSIRAKDIFNYAIADLTSLALISPAPASAADGLKVEPAGQLYLSEETASSQLLQQIATTELSESSRQILAQLTKLSPLFSHAGAEPSFVNFGTELWHTKLPIPVEHFATWTTAARELHEKKLAVLMEKTSGELSGTIRITLAGLLWQLANAPAA